MNHHAVLWIDPGGMTGLAETEGGHFWAWEYPFFEACQRIEWICDFYRSSLQLGYERFTITPETHKLTAQPEAMNVIGATRYLAAKYGCQLLPAAAPRDRLVATPAMLAEIGWWVPGKDDAQSAAQHLLADLMRRDIVPSVPAGKLAALRSRSGG